MGIIGCIDEVAHRLPRIRWLAVFVMIGGLRNEGYSLLSRFAVAFCGGAAGEQPIWQKPGC